MSGGDIRDVDDLVLSGSGSDIICNNGDIQDVDRIDMGTLEHQGALLGFYGASVVSRKTANLPTGTSNNELFIALFNIIQALGNLSGFGYGLVNSGQ